jgi:hypothetical protein
MRSDHLKTLALEHSHGIRYDRHLSVSSPFLPLFITATLPASSGDPEILDPLSSPSRFH